MTLAVAPAFAVVAETIIRSLSVSDSSLAISGFDALAAPLRDNPTKTRPVALRSSHNCPSCTLEIAVSMVSAAASFSTTPLAPASTALSCTV